MYDDNTAFVDYAPHMDITFYTEDNSYTVNHINRMRMDGSYSDYCPDALVLYTDKFGASTMTDSTGGQRKARSGAETCLRAPSKGLPSPERETPG